MKNLTLLLAMAALIGAAAFVNGQSVASAQTRIVYGGGTDITAKELRHDPESRTIYARGGVRIVTGSSTTTSDEADLHILRSTTKAVDLDIVFRGNVRMVVTPLNSGIR